MRASEIIELLQNPSEIGFNKKDKIKHEAPTSEIISALQHIDQALHRQILCDILGELHAQDALVPLIACLDDESSRVRSSAADALAKLGNVAAGRALLEHYLYIETELPVRQMLAAALGAVKYREAIPALMLGLQDADASLRGAVAWSLGHLEATESYSALQEALKHETFPYAIERMREAIAHLSTLIDP
jgi:HEAT repeat protein